MNPGKLLDVGCAAGFFLEAAAQHWQAVGSELSEYARRNAVDRSLRIYPGDFLKQEFEEAPFDVVTMWEVLEHLSDPLQACRKSASLLRPGGCSPFPRWTSPVCRPGPWALAGASSFLPTSTTSHPEACGGCWHVPRSVCAPGAAT